jgi:hypothetical protein
MERKAAPGSKRSHRDVARNCELTRFNARIKRRKFFEVFGP